MNFEIELRYQILDESGLADFTESLTFLHAKQILDIYLDTPQADLIRQGIYLRIRDYKKIDIKFNRACLTNPSLELQPYCEEYSFLLPFSVDDAAKFNSVNFDLGLQPADTLAEYMEINNLIQHRTVDKIRMSYSTQDFIIVVDNVKGLGNFLEIEIMSSNTDNIDLITNQMKAILAPLYLKPLKTGYDSLILRKQNFSQYLQGRFILEEDKKYLHKRL